MAQLRFAGAELPKHLCDGACLEAVSQQLVELFAPGVNFENLLALLVVLGCSCEAHGHELCRSILHLLHLRFAQPLDLGELSDRRVCDRLHLRKHGNMPLSYVCTDYARVAWGGTLVSPSKSHVPSVLPSRCG